MEIRKVKDVQIMTDSGYQNFDGIAYLGKQPLLTFEFDDGTEISVTYRHTFVVDDEEIEAFTLNVGEVLQGENGYKTITNISTDKEEDVYDILEVANGNKYFSNGILNHNCKFIGSTNTLIDSEVLERIEVVDPIDYKWESNFMIYEHPIEGMNYILGVDAADGIGQDYSVVQVLKIISEFEIEQVACFRSNRIEASKFAMICISISEYYFNSYMMIENNGVGSIVAEAIWVDHEYDYVLNCDKKGYGIRATIKTKLQGNMLLKKYLENYWLKLVDKQTHYELSQYEEIKPNVYACGDTIHDDLISGLIWALYFLITPFFDKDWKKKEVEEFYKLQEEDLPVAFSEDDMDNLDFDEIDDYDEFEE